MFKTFYVRATVLIFATAFILSLASPSMTQERRQQDRREVHAQEVLRQWEEVQENSPLIATMLMDSVTVLMMAKEERMSTVQLADIGTCFSGLLIGERVSPSCMVPMELLRPPCPCDDPLTDCNGLAPQARHRCLGAIARCRFSNNCQ